MWLNQITYLRHFLLISFASCVSAVVLSAQAPLLEDQVLTSSAKDFVWLDWQLESAERALESGLARVAEQEYRRILATEILSSDQADGVHTRLAVSLIAQQRFQAAHSALEQVAINRRNSAYYLYQAIVTYGNGRSVDIAQLNSMIASIRANELQPTDTAWLHLILGLRAKLAGETELILPEFERAATAAAIFSDGQKALFESLLYHHKLLLSPASDALAADVRGQLKRYQGQAAAYFYAREYALVLYNQGQIDRAVEVIDMERKNPELEVAEREQLLLLKGMVLGSSAPAGQEALQELLRNGQDRTAQRIALQILARNWDSRSDSLTIFLNELVIQAPAHPLLGQIYFIRSQLSLTAAQALAERGATDLASSAISSAENDALYILNQFPGLNQINQVFRSLAYAALQRTPPQYRAAADYLTQLRDQTAASNERSGLNQLIGDSYFLNADYVNAVDFYEAARDQIMPPENEGELFLRLISAQLRAGQIDSAMQRIDQIDFSTAINSADRWRAEWNIAQALRSQGQLEQALKRVRLLLASGGNGNVPTVLDLRLRWMEAYLSFLAADVTDLAARVDALITRLNSLPFDALAPDDAKLLTTELLLLKARVLIADGEASSGLRALQKIRSDSANSSAAERSYLIEANYQASVGDLKATQATLSRLAATHAESVLAPQAIFDAALYCAQRGPEFYPDAVRLHNEIVVKYPQHELVFSARLKQGDLLRQMNDFAGAQLVYDNVIHSYPRHVRRYIAELARADCMLALAQNNDSQLTDVALILERIGDTPGLPIDFQAEVGYKLGFALNRRGKEAAAQEQYTVMVSRLLLNQDAAARLGASGRYWVSRMLLAMAEKLELDGATTAARQVYLKMLAFNLPGRNLAQNRVERLQINALPQAE